MMAKHLNGINLVLLKWAVVPLLTFLLAGLVTNKVLRAKRGVDTERFNQTMAESVRKFESGDRQGALQGLELAAKMVPDGVAEQSGLFGKLEALGEHKKAAEVMERALRAAPKGRPEEEMRMHFARLSEYFLEHGDIEGARRVLTKDLMAKWPDSLETAFIQGEVALKEAKEKSDIEAAVKYFEKCATLDPHHVSSKVQLGIAYWRLSQVDKAEPLLRAALEKLPFDTIVLFHLGEVLRQQGKTEEAKPYLEKHRQISDLQQRRRHLEVQYSLNKYQPADLLELGKVYEQLGEHKSAASTLRVYIHYKPTDAEGHRELAQACLKLDDKEGARVATELADALSAKSQKQ